MSIKSICAEHVVCVSPERSITEAAALMRRHHVGALVVTEGAEEGNLSPVGMITDRDIVLEVVAPSRDAQKTFVREVMTNHPVTINSGVGIYEALKVMQRSGVKRAPITDESGYVVGVVSTDDIIELLAEELSEISTISRRQISNEMEGRSN